MINLALVECYYFLIFTLEWGCRVKNTAVCQFTPEAHNLLYVLYSIKYYKVNVYSITESELYPANTGPQAYIINF